MSVNELIGIVTKQLNYHTDRKSSLLGEKLIQSKCESVSVMPIVKATYLQQHLQLGRTGYQVLKKVLKNFDEHNDIQIKLPNWDKVRTFQKNIMPPILHDTSITGVHIDYVSALKITIERLLDLHIKTPISTDLTVLVKDGVDESGSHAIYQQKNNANSHNIIMYMFCVLRITESGSNTVIFEEKLSASPFSMRPVFLVLGKESIANLEDVRKTVRERQADPNFSVTTKDGSCYQITIKADLSMIDAKMRTLLTSLGGAYCLLCTVDKDTACGRFIENNPEEIESKCFHINRSYQKTREDYERLSDEYGNVKRKKKDYSDRHGITQEPLVDEDLEKVSPLHCLMRVWEFCQLMLYHLCSGTFIWTESAKKLGDDLHQSFTNAKQEVKACVKMKTGITMDAVDATGKGGNTNKGDVCQRLLTDFRHVIVELVPEEFQEDFQELLCRLWIAVKVYTSKDSVNTNLFKDFCLETYLIILTKFNNVDLSGSLFHLLFIHYLHMDGNLSPSMVTRV